MFYYMFDDQSQSAGGTVPPNLPVAEPEDIFATVESVPPTLPPVQAISVDSMTSDQTARTALSAGVLRPKAEMEMGLGGVDSTPTTPPSPVQTENLYAQSAPVVSQVPQRSQQPVALPNEAQARTLPTDVPEMYAVREPKTSRGIITVLILLLVLTILGVGAFFLYTTFIAGPNTSTTVQDTNTNTINVPEESIDTTLPGAEDIVEPGEDGSGDRQSDILFGVPVDTDADGLEDQREQGLGTDPAHWDTDGDELSDGDEVIIWKTDPLNPDTDGDGFFDGAEIKNGYSPTGPGKIFEPPTAETTTSST
jgi:hypothetical protein